MKQFGSGSRAAVGVALLVVLLCCAPAQGSDAVWGSYGTEPGQFGVSIRHVAIDAAGNVYVTDGGDCVGQQGCVTNDRVQKFTQDGNLLAAWGGTGAGDGQFHAPMGLAVAAGGDVYVADFSNNRVQQLSSTGQFVRKWASMAWDLVIDSTGNVITAGYDGLRKYDATGQPLKTLSTSPFYAIAIDAQDNLYVVGNGSCSNCSSIAKFDSTGTSLGTIVASGAADGHVGTVNDVAVDGSNLYTIDNASTTGSLHVFRVQRFDLSGGFLAKLPLQNIHGTGYSFSQGIAATGGLVYLADVLSPTLQGGCCSFDERVVRLDTTQPTARLTASPRPALTGDPVAFDAAGSSVPLALITRYQWDLDGDGTFERDTGTVPHATRSYAAVGTHLARVRVTSEGGRTDTDAVTFAVRSRPPEGPVGGSINDGADFTNDPHVTLRIVWPAFTTNVIVSNDGGFGTARTFAVDESIPWTLRSSGPERLPKTVYVRFDDSSQTFQDDIILDETNPAVTTADVAPEAGFDALRAAANARRQYVIRLKASDRLSGVSRVQVGNKEKTVIARLAYRRQFTVSASRKPAWIRVRDRAGNLSKWRRLTAAKA